MDLSNVCRIAREHILKGRTPLAVDTLLAFFSEFRPQNGIVLHCQEIDKKLHLIRGQYSRNSSDQRNRLSSFDFTDTRSNNLAAEVIEIITEMEEWEGGEETTNYLSKSRDSTASQILSETAQIELTIDRDFEKFKDQDKKKLLNAIAELLNMDESMIIIKKITKGSVKITLEFKKENVLKLNSIIKKGKLRHLKVTESKVFIQSESKQEANSISEILLQSESKLVIILFTAEWLGGSYSMLNTLLEEIISEQTELAFYQLDVEVDQKLASEFGISQVPTLFFLKDGFIQEVIIGILGKRKLKQLITKFSLT